MRKHCRGEGNQQQVGQMRKHAMYTLVWLLTLPFAGYAQNFPSKPLQWIVPYAVGGGTDTLVRLIVKEFEKVLGQSVVIHNRPGGNTMVATQALLGQPADGYTVASLSQDTLAVNPHLYQFNYDVDRDFEMIGQTAIFPYVLVGRAELPVRSGREALDYMKRNGSKINYGTYGSGSVAHIGMEMLFAKLGVRMTQVPYRGGAPAIQGMLGGQIDFMLTDMSTVMPHVKTGKLKALAVTGKARSKFMPDVPTIAESGLPGYDYDSWQGIVVKKGTPEEIVQQLTSALKSALDNPAVRNQLEARGIQPNYSTPAQFQKLAADERAAMAKLIREANIKAD